MVDSGWGLTFDLEEHGVDAETIDEHVKDPHCQAKTVSTTYVRDTRTCDVVVSVIW